MRMSTNATTGCFRYIVEPRSETASTYVGSSLNVTLSTVDLYGIRKVTLHAQVSFFNF